MNPNVRSWSMPVAMVVGALFHDTIDGLDVLSPWLIAAMLFVTFTRVKASELKIERLHYGQLAVQFIGSLLVYLLLRFCGVNEIICQGALICVLVPTAMASVVVGGMLGANVTTMTTFTLLSNMLMALVAPVVFSFVGTHTELPFLTSFWLVFRRLLLLVVLPFLLSQLLGRWAPRAFEYVRSHQSWSFYLWIVSLTILMASTTTFILAQPSENVNLEIWLAVAAIVLCVSQFAVGRALGRRCGDVAAGGQSVGQKNTLLAILLAQSYLHPLSSVAPAAYIVCQNIINSWQLSRNSKKRDK
ncbi:MAG: transporter [Tidjanibacter sp.]|nr:transporter [Tidjanibacter sp.]